MVQLMVTGVYRSGTTLIERLLDQHPRVALASQPLPMLWIAAKRAYLQSRGRDDALPLGTLFRDPDNDPDELRAFLSRWPDSGASLLDSVLQQQAGYSGAMSPQVADLPVGEAPDGAFVPLVDWCHRQLAGALERDDAHVVGSKEILVEEFVPLLLQHGQHVVMVIRDPRAVVASTVGGAGSQFAGTPRPTLFTVRAWRRAADLALAYREQARCRVVRYEDMLDEPKGLVDSLHQWLGLEPLDELPDPLLDQQGRPWTANTSFSAAPVDAGSSQQRAEEVMDPTLLSYVEALTGPELRAWGYPFDPDLDIDRALDAFREPVPVRDGFPADLSTSSAAIADERRRLELVDQDLDEASARQWFLDPEAHRALRRSVTNRD